MLFAIPEQQAFIWPLTCVGDQGDEELVGLQVVRRVPAVVASIVAALDVGLRLVTMPVSEHPRPPRRDQEQGVTTSDAGGLDNFPGLDQSEIFEVLKSHLTGTQSGKEKLFDLEVFR